MLPKNCAKLIYPRPTIWAYMGTLLTSCTKSICSHLTICATPDVVIPKCLSVSAKEISNVRLDPMVESASNRNIGTRCGRCCQIKNVREMYGLRFWAWPIAWANAHFTKKNRHSELLLSACFYKWRERRDSNSRPPA